VEEGEDERRQGREPSRRIRVQWAGGRLSDRPIHRQKRLAARGGQPRAAVPTWASSSLPLHGHQGSCDWKALFHRKLRYRRGVQEKSKRI